MALQTVGISGAGAWGTALAIIARRAGRDVLIWAYEPETVADINQKHRNETFLPGIKLDQAIEATARFNEVANCDILLMVTPAQHVRFIAGELAHYVRRWAAAGDLLQGHRADDRQADVAGRGRGAAGCGDRRAVRPELRRRDRARAARGGDARDGGGGARPRARPCAEPPSVPLLLERRRGRRARSAAR